jgi:hypothetical protein
MLLTPVYDSSASVNQIPTILLRYFSVKTLFFKSLAGAAIADVLLSLIATAAQAKINVFEYLIVLQRHAKEVKQNPQQWLPWTYQNTLQALELAA